MAIALRNHWKGQATPGIKLCPLLADLDGLLVYLDAAGIRPGHAIYECPACGADHRWALLHELMIHVLEIRPASQSRLLTIIDRKLEVDREMYGGEKGFRSMRQGAEVFFAGLDRKKSP